MSQLNTQGCTNPGEPENSSLPPRQAILDARHPGAWENVGGLPLVGRALYHLGRAGIEEVVLLARAGDETKGLSRWQGSVRLRRELVEEPGQDVPGIILGLRGLEQTFVYIDASHLMDPRLIAALTSATASTLAFLDAADKMKREIRAGLMWKQDVLLWKERGSEALILRSKSCTPLDVDPFVSEVRGVATPYFMKVSSGAEADEATWALISCQQKHVMDLPAQYLHPPIANALTFYLCKTPVTPNMVTLMVVCLALVVTSLFWHGHFVLGALLTFSVDILDGVDGKLARTRLQFSKLGQYEHLFDYFYENSWYLALGVGLGSRYAGGLPLVLSWIMIVSDTADNIWYTLSGSWYGKSIDLFSPWDGLFRKIGGRRNIYGAMFIVGFVLGYPLATFAAASGWALLTASIHGCRLVQYGRALRDSRGRAKAGS